MTTRTAATRTSARKAARPKTALDPRTFQLVRLGLIVWSVKIAYHWRSLISLVICQLPWLSTDCLGGLTDRLSGRSYRSLVCHLPAVNGRSHRSFVYHLPAVNGRSHKSIVCHLPAVNRRSQRSLVCHICHYPFLPVHSAVLQIACLSPTCCQWALSQIAGSLLAVSKIAAQFRFR